jgi:hypothetical protein
MVESTQPIDLPRAGEDEHTETVLKPIVNYSENALKYVHSKKNVDLKGKLNHITGTLDAIGKSM